MFCSNNGLSPILSSFQRPSSVRFFNLTVWPKWPMMLHINYFKSTFTKTFNGKTSNFVTHGHFYLLLLSLWTWSWLIRPANTISIDLFFLFVFSVQFELLILLSWSWSWWKLLSFETSTWAFANSKIILVWNPLILPDTDNNLKNISTYFITSQHYI